MVKKVVKDDLKRKVSFLSKPVASFCRGGRFGAAVAVNNGELYGLELELEGRNVAMDGAAVRGWTQHRDGSLRGESIEYVFANPAPYEDSQARVKSLFKKFHENKVALRNSYRCSTHMHINMGDKPVSKLFNMFVVFTIIEELLEAHMAGEGREGNLFCLMNRDAEQTIKLFSDSLEAQSFAAFHNDLRYAAMNLASLNKFGTVEFRSMRGADDAESVQIWLTMLHELYDFVVNKMAGPVELIESMSRLGHREWLANIFSEDVLRRLLETWGERDLSASLYEGARLVQVLCYRWDEALREVPVVVPKKPVVAADDAIMARWMRDDVATNAVPWAADTPVYNNKIYFNGRIWSTGREENEVFGVAPENIIKDRWSGKWWMSIDAGGRAVVPRAEWLFVEAGQTPREAAERYEQNRIEQELEAIEAEEELERERMEDDDDL